VIKEVFGALSNEPYEPVETEPHGSTRRKWQMTALSLLQEREAPSY